MVFLNVALASTLLAVAYAIGPNTQLHITNKVISPDGFSRSAVAVNGQFPAPLITGKKGDQFSITVRDFLSDKSLDTVTSVHWHGIFQHGTAHADGPAFVTQCPLIPSESFNYKFSTPDQAGTYWYHSHYRNQYCDGLRGPLVIYDPKDPNASLYDVDDENTVITLADWYHYLSTDAPSVPSPSTTLINGKGRYAGGPLADLSVVNVTHGKRYRFRLVSVSCDTNFIFSVDGHQLTVIEVDGVNHHALVVDNLQIFSAQRYSVILHANQPINNYWIRAQPNNINPSFENGMNSAILRYAGAQKTDPTTQSSLSKPLIEQNLHPLENPAAPGKPVPGGADINIELDVKFNGSNFLVNDVSFQAPSVPVLLQLLKGTPAASLLPSENIYKLPRNKTVEITIPGGVTGGPHPVHLHGHVFSVVRSAGSTNYNFVNPPKRDVVSIGSSTSDKTTIRFTTDNPGPWFMHCHIDWHLGTGFAVVMAEDVPALETIDHLPVAYEALCPVYNAYINSPQAKIYPPPSPPPPHHHHHHDHFKGHHGHAPFFPRTLSG